jgi:hypothetical protein
VKQAHATRAKKIRTDLGLLARLEHQLQLLHPPASERTIQQPAGLPAAGSCALRIGLDEVFLQQLLAVLYVGFGHRQAALLRNVEPVGTVH